ncbi:MAG: hypothetical protein HN348_10290 [Proteobacteria bacterium]|jgi:hypothetical protein|nr:hypothetical protein [Pseudomonadota bacterium]
MVPAHFSPTTFINPALSFLSYLCGLGFLSRRRGKLPPIELVDATMCAAMRLKRDTVLPTLLIDSAGRAGIGAQTDTMPGCISTWFIAPIMSSVIRWQLPVEARVSLVDPDTWRAAVGSARRLDWVAGLLGWPDNELLEPHSHSLVFVASEELLDFPEDHQGPPIPDDADAIVTWSAARWLTESVLEDYDTGNPAWMELGLFIAESQKGEATVRLLSADSPAQIQLVASFGTVEAAQKWTTHLDGLSLSTDEWAIEADWHAQRMTVKSVVRLKPTTGWMSWMAAKMKEEPNSNDAADE